MTEPQKPDLARIVLDLQKQGRPYASAHTDDMAVTKFGMNWRMKRCPRH